MIACNMPAAGPVLAIDIGGTKFSLAIIEGGVMIRRESRATSATGGRDWMLEQITQIVTQWRSDFRFTSCGIGFGGPVDFKAQRVVLSTHVGGWKGFDLCGFMSNLTGSPAIMDNDANAGALGEAV